MVKLVLHRDAKQMPVRILIVEDNETNLELMSYLLEAFGYTAVLARNGHEGLGLAHGSNVDLIVCDLELPDLSGFEVCRRIQAHAEFQKVPIVAVSALAMVGDRERVLAAGFDGYISKPIQPES